jgi:hypothetical protein
MRADAVEGTLLDVQLDQEGLRLRLDTNGLWQGQEKHDPITTVHLSGCSEAAGAAELLRPHVRQFLYLEPVEEAGAIVGASLELDYGADEMQIACTRVTQEHREYTPGELRGQCQWLRSAYTRSEDARLAAERHRTRLASELAKMVNSELDRSRRKFEFFLGTSAERASEMSGRIVAYERVLARLAQLQESGEGAALYNDDVSR